MSTATKLGDIGLVGFAVFVATALVAVTLGAPALSESTPTSAESPAAAGHHDEDGEHADGTGSGAAADDRAADDHHGDHDTASPQPGDAQGHEHEPGDEGQTATALAADHHEHDDDHHEHDADHAQEPSSGHTGSAQDGHDHGEDAEHGDDGHGHADHDDGHGAQGHDSHEDHDSHQDHDDHEDHGDDGEHDGHDGHDHANMYAGCDDIHPETQQLRAEVQHSLTHLYPDPAMLIAQGYIPYFDAQIPGALATEGIGHWLNPEYIDNGAELDPTRPESILTDEWYRPIGVMFIENNDGQDPTPVYVNDDGTPCSPWHPHTDMPARIGWWYYRQVHDGAAYNDGEVAPDEETLAMMHMWAVDNPHGVYAAHDYPPAESRQGFPPPRAGYDTPATPIDEYLPDLENPDTYPFDAADTCPHCPDSPDGDTTDDGHQHDDAHDDHDSHGDDGHDGQDHDGHGNGDDGGGEHDRDGHDHANMYAGCDDDHPESVALRGAVTDSLSTMYTDVATLVAKGYVPYPDIILPGITHWLKPPQIYDERVMDPLAPEAVLTDVWHRPVGMMFVEHPDERAPAVYVNDDGTECYPWHPHTDAPAVFAWNAAEAVYQQNPEYEDVTPAMMHVWVANPHGMYAAHDYPPPSDPPGPLPSYLADTAVQDALDDAFDNEESTPVFEALYEMFARIEEGVLEFNGEPPDLPTG